MVFCCTDPDALDADSAERLAQRLLGHPLVGRSQLKGTFEGSRGFGVAFTHSGRATVRERFPFVETALTRLESPPTALLPRRGSWPFGGRLSPNASYVNVLVVGDGQGIGRHIDGTLGEPAATPGLTPVVVSVLYLRVPPCERGGELSLFHDDHRVETITPRPGLLVHFRGDLAHEIASLHGADGLRVSLVCEQYVLSEEQLARLAPFTVQSRASDPLFRAAGEKRAFSDYLG